MSSERRLFLALVLAIAAIFLVEWLLPTPPPPHRQNPAPAKVDAEGPPPPPPVAPGTSAGAPPAPAEKEPDLVEPFEFRSGRLTATLDQRGASVGRTRLRGVPAAPPTPEAPDPADLAFLEDPLPDGPGALAVTLESPNIPRLSDLEKARWTLVSKPGEVPVVWQTRCRKAQDPGGEALLVEKRFMPAEDAGAWHLRMQLSVTNHDPTIPAFPLTIRVRGSALLHEPVQGSRDFLYGRAKVRGVASVKETSGEAIAKAKKEKELEPVTGDIEWAAASSTYFAAILDPVEEAGSRAPRKTTVEWDALRPLPTAATPHPAAQPSPILCIETGVPKVGETVRVEVVLFVGPTADEVTLEGERAPVLDREEYDAYRPVRNPGWLGALSGGLFWILKWFHTLIPNWGVAIVLLTVLVRGLLFPLSRKQMKSTIEFSRKMQKIKPKLEALKEKHGNDRQRMSQEQFRLMKENDVPILPGGCLLTFLQLPIWIALYDMLQKTYDLRHATFLWIVDLSQADHLLHWLPGVRTVPLVPNSLEWLNLLPLVMTATWFFASKATMTPPADEQQAQMQKMMQWMPFIMLMFPGFYDMPAGLCLYITASSTWGIVESRLIRKSLGATK